MFAGPIRIGSSVSLATERDHFCSMVLQTSLRWSEIILLCGSTNISLLAERRHDRFDKPFRGAIV